MSQATQPIALPPMRPPEKRFGLSCASITPVDADGFVDRPRLVAHLRRCLAEGCSSFTLFGTTGEGSSIGLRDRGLAIEAVLREFGPDKALVGVMASAAADAALQADPLLDAGGKGVLLAPPFYFKGVGEDPLYAWFCRAIDAMRAPRGIFIYHLPQVTAVPIPLSLVGRLAAAYPGVVVGVKDSAGEWDYTARLLAAHPELHILVGDERLLARAIRHGGSGAINGFSNFCAARLLPAIERGEEMPGVAAMVDFVLTFPVTPAIKALVAHLMHDPEYARAAPPLRSVTSSERDALVRALEALPPR